MKKYMFLFTIIVFLFINGSVYAEEACTKEAAQQLAKIVYHETGADSAVDYNENFFMRINAASVALNNASRKSGDTWYKKIYNLTDNNNSGYSSYKNKSFDEAVPAKQGEMLYIAELVLSGKYNLPKNMTLQANLETVNTYGKEWTHVECTKDFYSVYYGYEGGNLSDKDVFGKNITNNSVEYYKNKANSLKLSDYSKYTKNSVCSGLSNSKTSNNQQTSSDSKTSNNPSNKNTTPQNNVNGGSTKNNNSNKQPTTNNNVENNNNNNNKKEKENTYNGLGDACTNPEVLKVIYFIKILINIVKIIIPIVLIILGTLDFSKSVITSDEKSQKKNLNLFIKRIIYAVLVFAVPWIVETVMIWIGNITSDETNFTDCLENATSEKIKELE